MWTDRQTDGQTDVGHINLIGGLVTRNPPKKYCKCNSFQVGNDILNSDNRKVTITQLYNKLQVYNFTK